MSSEGYTVFIVEDDPSVRDAIGLLLGLHGFPVTMFGDAESFLAAQRPEWAGCALIDIRMPGIDGLSLQKRLRESACRLPVIIMTAHGDVESARQAFLSQAVDFLEKPIDHERLVAAIRDAFDRQSAARQAAGGHEEFRRRVASLTPREKQVMELIIEGRHNREIAETLGISARTVEVHKSRVMAKCAADSVPDLVRLSLLGGSKAN